MKEKNLNKYLWILILCCTALLAALYCLGLTPPKAPQGYRKRFTFLSPLTWSNTALGIQDADQENNTHTKLLGSATMDIYRQAQAFRDELSARPDGIITSAPVDSLEFRAALKEAASLSIPVVLIDSDLPDSGRNAYVGTDNDQIGKLAGQEMIDATQGKARIAIITSDLGYPNQQERINAFTEAIRPYEEMEIACTLECHSEKLEVQRLLPALLYEDGNIDALYLTEAVSSAIAGELLQKNFSGRSFQVIATDSLTETMDFVSSGTYYATIIQDPRQEGYLAAKALMDILDGKTIPDTIFTDCRSIRKDAANKVEGLKAEEVAWIYY